MELLKEYEDNGVVIEEVDGTTYNITFDAKYSGVIEYNLNTLGLDGIIFSAKHRALDEGEITNYIKEPYVYKLKSTPYEFEVNAPFSVMIYFIQRIIVN